MKASQAPASEPVNPRTPLAEAPAAPRSAVRRLLAVLGPHRAWMAGDDRFGRVDSPLPRIEVGPPPWSP